MLERVVPVASVLLVEDDQRLVEDEIIHNLSHHHQDSETKNCKTKTNPCHQTSKTHKKTWIYRLVEVFRMRLRFVKGNKYSQEVCLESATLTYFFELKA